MLVERIASQSEVIRAIVSGYSPWCGLAHLRLAAALGLLALALLLPALLAGLFFLLLALLILLFLFLRPKSHAK